MPFQISPGVNVTEKDLTNIVPAVATTIGGIAGYFNWGPAEERTLIDSENNLVTVFGKPDNNNAEQWWTAANFLGYAEALEVVRTVNSDAFNSIVVAGPRGDAATDDDGSNGAGILLKNADAYYSGVEGGTLPSASSDGLIGASGGKAEETYFAAKWPGTLGNSLKVSVSDKHEIVLGNGGVAGSGITTGAAGTNHMMVPGFAVGEISVGDTITLASNNYTVTGFTGAASGDGAKVVIGGGVTAQHTAEDAIYTHVTFKENLVAADVSNGATATVKWAYSGNFSATPDTSTDAAKFGAANDEVNIAVIDEDGLFSGARGTVLETFTASKARDARKFDGTGNYYVNVINEQSKYIWWGDHLDNLGTVSGTTAAGAGVKWGDSFKNVENASLEDSGSGVTFESLTRNFYGSFVNGTDGTGFTDTGRYTGGYDQFADAETVDMSLILGANAEATLAGQLIELVDARKDCLAFLSPLRSNVVDKTATVASDNAVDYYNNTLNKSSSYGVFDSGWKYQYDRYNDIYRYIPLNGDVAGLCARTELTNDAWWSPAGFNRGQIRSIVKLAYNPRKAHRDKLYKNNLNPVVAFPGEGTILFGDKTMQRKPSAFDRINVRRLFIVLEKAIATAAKYQLFEFNDEFTRSNFVNMVTPFLRDVQGRRGIFDFRVVCDETNNTGEIIDRNEFVADIFIKPARSINFIQLNFVAVRTGVDFEEVAGA